MLLIKQSDLQSVLDHCRAGLPNEACGLLAGRSGVVKKIYPMRNAKPGPCYYEMDPEEQFRVMRDMRQAGFDLLGIFHSHPTSPAYPSGIDVEKAYWPGTVLPNYPDAVYVIVSLLDRDRPLVKGYSISEGTVVEAPVSVVAEEK